MGLAGTRKTMDVPGEPGASVTIKQLNWSQLDKARSERLRQAAAIAGDLGGLKASDFGLTDEQIRAASDEIKTDTAMSYDRLTVLKYGVAEWSYEGKVDVENLDERTAAWLAKEIIEFSVPNEDAISKGSSSSTAT